MFFCHVRRLSWCSTVLHCAAVTHFPSTYVKLSSISINSFPDSTTSLFRLLSLIICLFHLFSLFICSICSVYSFAQFVRLFACSVSSVYSFPQFVRFLQFVYSVWLTGRVTLLRLVQFIHLLQATDLRSVRVFSRLNSSASRLTVSVGTF